MTLGSGRRWIIDFELEYPGAANSKATRRKDFLTKNVHGFEQVELFVNCALPDGTIWSLHCLIVVIWWYAEIIVRNGGIPPFRASNGEEGLFVIVADVVG